MERMMHSLAKALSCDYPLCTQTFMLHVHTSSCTMILIKLKSVSFVIIKPNGYAFCVQYITIIVHLS